MSEENKALDRRWWEEVWNQGSISSYQELASRDFVMHNTPQGITGNFEGIRQANLNLRTGFPEHRFEIDAQVAEGDRVVTLWTWTGTHQGEWLGIPPTGKQASIQGMSLQRYQNGKIVESWLAVDMLPFLQQLGVAPSL